MAVNANVKLKVFQHDKYRCVECGRNEDLTIDHIVPLSKGGSDELHNLQTMCQKCNFKKANKKPSWLQRMFKWASHQDLNDVRTDLLAISDLHLKKSVSDVKNHVNITLDNRLGGIEPKVNAFIVEKISGLEKNALLKVTGFTNTLEAYNNRSKERDDKLLKIIYLLSSEVEDLKGQLKAVDK